MKLVYEGNNPPADMAGTPGRTVDDTELEQMFTTGRQANDNYSIIIQDGPVRKYWYPKGPPITPGPQFLSATAFQDVCEAGLGGGAAGRQAFGAVLRAMETSADDEVLSVYLRYTKTVIFDKSKVTALLTLLVAKGIINNMQKASILNAWP